MFTTYHCIHCFLLILGVTCLLLSLMIDCGFRLSANNFLFVADTDTCKITLYRLLPIIQPIIGATLVCIYYNHYTTVLHVLVDSYTAAYCLTMYFPIRNLQEGLGKAGYGTSW